MSKTKTTPIVFISSTCVDLIDLRAELREHLEKDGFIVKLSEDPESGFRVDPGANDIQSCLGNLRESDIVLFIFDRRYGDCLKEYGNLSPVHLEFNEARKHRKAMLNFVRDSTMQKYRSWVEAGCSGEDGTDKGRLFRLIKEVITRRKVKGHNNWYGEFKASPDLRKLVTKRLYDEYREFAGGRALTRERVVRLTFTTKRETDDSNLFNVTAFRVKNAGLSVAADVSIVLQVDGKDTDQARLISAIAVDGESERAIFKVDSNRDYTVVCRYSNLWGDNYEISLPFNSASGPSQAKFGLEKFRVVQSAD